MDWADGAVQTLFGQNGAGAGQTLFGGRSQEKKGPSLATLATDLLLIGLRVAQTSTLGSAAELRNLLLAYLKDFERSCGLGGKAPESVNQAKYALTAFLDETILNTPNDCREQWVQEPLQVQLFNDHSAGEHFFKHLEELLTDLQKNHEVLEVFYFCLALGFQGRYQGAGADKLPNLVRNLLRRLESVRGTPPKAISPSAYVQPGPRGKTGSGKWLIAVSLVMALLSVGLFVVLQLASDSPVNNLEESLRPVLETRR
jgi:type VI secretion system protein ImpK